MEVLKQILQKTKSPVLIPDRVIKDYPQASRVFWHIMQKNIPGEIILQDEDVFIIQNMIRWLMNDPDCAWNLTKGILLCGTYGIGKSTLMKCASTYAYLKAAEGRQFKFVRVNDILKKVDAAGRISEIGAYTTGNWCLDDIGQMNEDVNLFGTRHNVVETLINDRVGKHIITHGTTNVKPEHFQDKFGRVVESRMHQMFTFVVYKSKLDHRKNK